MSTPRLSDEVLRETVDAVARWGSQTAAAAALKIPYATLQSRYREARARGYATGEVKRCEDYAARMFANIEDGVVIVFSDAHYYPGEASTAHKALVRACKIFQPRILVCNGDAFDGASISRHPRIGWDSKPTVKQELEVVTERLAELEAAAGGNAQKVWTMGNHDARFETFLAANAPQFEQVGGFRLKDHFPMWSPAWRLDINAGESSHTIIKHRGKGGIHAPHNNTAAAGVSMVTGHLHKLDVRRWTDARGTRYGVDTGCIAEAQGDHCVDYTEDGITHWRSGFAVLTYRHGHLLAPELVEVTLPGTVEFRGKEYRV